MMRRHATRALKAAAFAVLVLSCEGEELPPPGQLMLVFNTDMKLPDDVSSVVLEVTSFGSTIFSNEYQVGAGKLLMPSTFGIVVGEDPSTPVRVRLIGFQGSAPRVLREVVTTVPEDRIAMLRMPIQWLCEGTAVSDGSGIDPKDPAGITTTCGDEETCLAGTCASADVDSSTLPDYSAEKVFGGGSTPEDGSCFDTLACFASAETVEVDEGCTVADPGGDVNVAMVLPAGGDGICDAQRCLIPLSGESETGWQRGDGKLALPSAVCDRIAEGRVEGVQVSAACSVKTDAIPTCGSWSNVGTGGAGDGGGSVIGGSGTGGASDGGAGRGGNGGFGRGGFGKGGFGEGGFGEGGGGQLCRSCGEFLGAASSMPFPQTDLCPNSLDIWLVLRACICTTPCMTECATSMCDDNVLTPDLTCQTCLENTVAIYTACGPEVDDCQADGEAP